MTSIASWTATSPSTRSGRSGSARRTRSLIAACTSAARAQGGLARVQYIGMAAGQTVGERFESRYAHELRLTCDFEGPLRELPEAFSLKRRSPDPSRYHAMGIIVSRRLRTRPSRAERYAKIGRTRLWHLVLPISNEPGHDAGGVLPPSVLERALISAASADLFDMFNDNRTCGFPLLNRTHVRSNPFVRSQRAAYDRWLDDGPWWEEMNAFVRAL